MKRIGELTGQVAKIQSDEARCMFIVGQFAYRNLVVPQVHSDPKSTAFGFRGIITGYAERLAPLGSERLLRAIEAWEDERPGEWPTVKELEARA